MIDFLIPTPLIIGLLLVPFCGLFLIKRTTYRKTGIALIVVSLGFVLFAFIGFLLSWLTVSILDAHPELEALRS